jgi:hypothetical protein
MSTLRWLFTALIALFGMGLCPLLGQSPTLTLTVTGTLGPVLSGPDRFGLDGRPVVFTITTSESLPPFMRKGSAVEYQPPISDVSATVAGIGFVPLVLSGFPPLTLAAALTPTADIGIVSGVFSNTNDGGAGFSPVRGTIFLEPGSWNKTVLKHMTAFSPSPQNLTAAASATGPGSKLEYNFGGATVLGLTGTASSSN